MSCLKAVFSVYGSSDFIVRNRAKGSFRVCSSFQNLQFKESNTTEFWGRTLDVLDQNPVTNLNFNPSNLDVQNSNKWWEKSLGPNMLEIQSAQQLVDSLLNADDRLVVLHFYSPGCGGCRTLHPKMCQIAEKNPNAIFLNVNYEQHKAMCYALNVHVLPFFRFYKGAEGKVCSFSCTNATIKKFKDAMGKHGTGSCQPGPAKGLDESQLMALASMGLLSRNLGTNSAEDDDDDTMEDLVLRGAAAMVMA